MEGVRPPSTPSVNFHTFFFYLTTPLSKTLTEHKESGGNDYANIVQDEDCPEIVSLKIEDSYNIQCGRERENNPCDKTKHSHFRTICGVCNNMENRLINRNWIEN